MNVLYIEDDEDHAILFIDVLTSLGSLIGDVVHKRDLTSAIAALSQRSFDVAIVDLGLPESRGLETLSRLLPHAARTPIVVLTTNDDFELSLEAIKAGAQDYLVKSEIQPNSIERALRYAVERFRTIDELEKKQESLNTYVVAASHDLMTPLHNIFLKIEMFRLESGESITPRVEGMISDIQNFAGQLNSLIGSLVEFMKADAGLALSKPIDVKLCIGEALKILKVEVEGKQAEISVDDEFPPVRGSYGLLVRVFQNLLLNALTYVKDSVPRIHIGCRKSGNDIVFFVRDNGVGFDGKYAERIFEPLKRLHSQHEFPGSGIGLAICRRIVNAHRGRIWAESQPGQGSTFYFTLLEAQEVE